MSAFRNFSRSLFFFCVMASVLLQACDPYGQDEFEEELVIEVFLTSGQAFPDIQLTKTLPFDQVYNRTDAAVSGKNITVSLLDEGNEPEQTFFFEETVEKGLYAYSGDTHVVQPGRRYLLEVRETTGAEPVLRATTFVPGGFDLVADNGDTFVYQGPIQYEPVFTPSEYPGRQTYYIASVRAIQPEPDQLTPFYAGLFEEENPNEFNRISSGIINEENYDRNPDGTITIQLPWVAIAYYGLNSVSIYAIDTNIYDYIRTLNIQQGGSTLSPGQIENIIWNVEGGIGIFGSRSGVERTITVTE